ncbi:unnamed protein product [Chrysoparadoxa australica]
MSLTPLTPKAVKKLLPVSASRDQWTHYWEGSGADKAGKVYETAVICFLGLWASYFVSFFLGVAVTSMGGAAFAFYWLLGPSFQAYSRNRAFCGRLKQYPGDSGSRAALFSTTVASAREDINPFSGKPMYLRLTVEDEEGRALQIKVKWREEYARIRVGMQLETVLLSEDEDFETIAGVTDAVVRGVDVWVGDYPYLDKAKFCRLLALKDQDEEEDVLPSQPASGRGGRAVGSMDRRRKRRAGSAAGTPGSNIGKKKERRGGGGSMVDDSAGKGRALWERQRESLPDEFLY